MKQQGWWLLAALTSTGCGLVDAVKGALNPTVVIGAVVSVDAPDDDRIDLSALGLSSGLGSTVFLADARDVTHLQDAPITGANVTLRGCQRSMILTDESSGTYVGLPIDDLELAACKGPFTLSRTDGSRPFDLPVSLPQASGVSVASEWHAGQAMSLDLSSQGWGAAYVAVYELESQSLTWSNQPEDILGYYQLLTGKQDLSNFEIPGSAFRPDADYALVLTGLAKVKNAEAKNINTLLSIVDGGRAVPYFVTTRSLPDPE